LNGDKIELTVKEKKIDFRTDEKSALDDIEDEMEIE